MKLRDGRKLTNAELHDRRKQAVLLYKKGETRGEIGRLLGAHRNTVSNWISAWEKRGASALKPRTKGVSKGSGRSLTPEQERYIRLRIIDKAPDQLKLPFALWTREAVAEFIFNQYGFRMPVRTSDRSGLPSKGNTLSRGNAQLRRRDHLRSQMLRLFFASCATRLKARLRV